MLYGWISIVHISLFQGMKLADALFDFVVIAVLDIKIVEEIEQSLLKNGIPEYKIAKMDANVIGDEDFWEDFEM